MSNIYIQEPPTNGKVLLQTTVGDIDIELWSKETPKSCRNFVQLCLEGYYDGTKFHRLIKGFIVQGGDPNGDGTGGESIYGQPFKDEFHSRLRFVRRGLVALANSGKDDNGSQFFFTLGETPELQNKNTIFGKVTGNTLYNMLKLEESLVDRDDRPLYPHKIISTKVLSNPFPDIVPRVKIEVKEEVVEKPKEKVKKNYTLLSFGEEAEEEEAEIDAANQAFKGQSKSSHDLTDDPKLSSIPAIDVDRESDSAKSAETLENVRKKFDKANAERALMKEAEGDGMNMNESKKDGSLDKRKQIREEIKKLERELRKKKKENAAVPLVEEDSENKEDSLEEDNRVLRDYHTQLDLYKEKSKQIPQKKTSERENQTMDILAKFKSSMEAAKPAVSNDIEKDDSENELEDDNLSWFTHCFRTEEKKPVVAKDVNLPSVDRYDLSDPRNPMTERRRKEKKPKRSRTEL